MTTCSMSQAPDGQEGPPRQGWGIGLCLPDSRRWTKALLRGLRRLALIGCLLPALAQSPGRPLTVATNVGNPPYEYVDENGRPSGFNNDLLRALELTIGRQIDLQPMPFGMGRDAFERGELDAIGSVVFTEERSKVMDFTVPTHSMTYILLVRKGDRSINSERDLLGKTVVVNRRNSVADHFRAVGIPFQEEANNEDCINALAAGRADCAVAPKYTWLYFKNLRSYPGITVLPTEIYPSRRGIAVHKGNAELLAQLNEGIFRLKEDGTLDRLYAKHFGSLEASEVPLARVLKRAFTAVVPAVGLLLLAGLGLWSWALRRMVRKRTVDVQDELSRRSRLEAERERAMSELTLYKAHLEELVALRSRELQVANMDLIRAKEAAEAANQMKSSFLANMSHEIRTPMNAVTVLTHLALQTDLTDKQRQYLMKTKIAADSLLGIINDILDFSKIEAGKLQMDSKEFLLDDVFERITHLLGMKSADKQLEFLLNVAPDVPPSLAGDAMRLGQVLTNLCSNSVKFTESGEVVVTVKLIQTLDERVTLQFSVRDSGIGMTPEQTQLLFQPFSQVDDTSTRKFTGTGLGLAICKHLVTMMGGDIWVVTELGKGSEFFFTATFGVGHLLPARRDASSSGLTGLRILVVDDSPIARLILHGLATGLGYQAAMASGAEEAFAELQRTPYDLILLDWRMPGEDGIEVAGRIRRDLGLATVPRIIMVTAYGDEEIAQRVEQEGLDGYLTKPVSPSSLLDAITNAFGIEALPSPVRATRPEPAPRDLTRLRGARVLLVEDNDFNQQVAMELLALMGVEVTLAADGRQALEKIRPGAFDAVLMDLQMPVMDGYEATRQLRQDAAFATLPILAMTAHAMLPERERCLDLGMNDYITKPINPDELFGTLAKWIRPGQGANGADSLEPLPSAAHPETGPVEALAGISREAGLASFSGNGPLYEKMLGRFLELKPRAAEEIQAALDQGDAETASRLSHSMVAVAGTIGALDLSASSRALQYAIQSGVSEVIPPIQRQFEEHLATVVAGLKAHLSKA